MSAVVALSSESQQCIYQSPPTVSQEMCDMFPTDREWFYQTLRGAWPAVSWHPCPCRDEGLKGVNFRFECSSDFIYIVPTDNRQAV